MAAVDIQAARPEPAAAAAPRRQPAELPEGFWYGRTQIAGLEPGRRVRLRGMVGIGADGRPAMINPAYDLLG
jgi:hypothetical protein